MAFGILRMYILLSVLRCTDPIAATGTASENFATYKEYAANSESKLCSQVGARIMSKGGNAMDAAVGVTICIGLVNSFSSGLGGGGFLVIYKTDENDKSAFDMFDFRETAPAAAEAADYLGDPLSSLVGGLAVATPGELMGLYTAHAEYGKLAWKDLFEENIAIARNGFKASSILVRKLEKNRAAIMSDAGLREIYTRDGQIIHEGSLVVRRNMAETLSTIAESPMSFYKGKLADDIVAAVRAHGGVLSANDLAEYKARKRDVLKGEYRGYDVYTTSLPTAGVLVIEALKVLNKIDFDALRNMKENDGLYALYQILIETFKFISARRGELGDPDFIDAPDALLSSLLSEKNASSIAAKISLNNALNPTSYGQSSAFREDHGTTHLNIVDNSNMVVQVTSTINLEFGAKFMDPVTGIIFNNQMNDFYIPGVESFYALPPMESNIIKAGKRPFSSASPIFLVKEKEVIAMGAAGGTRIPTAILGTIAYLSLGLSLDEAVAECRVHNQLDPIITYIEPSFHKNVQRRLETVGQKLEYSDLNTLFTSVQAMQIRYGGDHSKTISAVADQRKHGGSAGK